MKRRRFISLLGAGATALSLPRLSLGQPGPGDYPNVIFIIIDDLNDWVGFMGGHPDTLTPNLDALGSQGVEFTNAQTCAPQCGPSRTAMMTGLFPSTTGVYENQNDWREIVPPGTVTLPHHFRNHGYRTVRCGKIYHSGQDEPGVWDSFYFPEVHPEQMYRPFDSLPGYWEGFGVPWGILDIKDDDMPDAMVVNRAIEELNTVQPDPFFLAVGTIRPHEPFTAPREYFEKFNPEEITLPVVNMDDLDDVPPIARSWARPAAFDDFKRYRNWRNVVVAYLACINHVDTMLGRLFNALADSPYADNTIVVVTSDHGYHFGQKRHLKKFTLWEEATRVPLIITNPGTVAPGGVCGQPASLADLYPTLIDMCGLDTIENLDGISLMPQLLDPATVRERPALITWEPNNHALRSERWRYIRYRDGTEELYDHDNDPYEWNNLASDPAYADIITSMAQWLP